MENKRTSINDLSMRTDFMWDRLSSFQKELEKLKNDIASFMIKEEEVPQEPTPKVEQQEIVVSPIKLTSEETPLTPPQTQPKQPKVAPVQKTVNKVQPKPQREKDVESYIGKNIISKVGILITILGVGIGTKYAIDHQLISPLLRIILGYVFGGILFGFAAKLKEKYIGFSAVLLSGSMSIFYFVTYFAFAYYDFIGREIAFGMMVIFTIFTVLAALRYDRQIIAHIGLVGAYAIPFLLSDGSNNIGLLFTYMAIINTGVLAIAVKKYWKSLFFSAFGFTWLIFSLWDVFMGGSSGDFNLSLTFMSIFFLIFYATILAYKLIHGKEFNALDIVLISANALIFYAHGMDLYIGSSMESAPGTFTLINAGIHFGVYFITRQLSNADVNLKYYTLGLGITFLTVFIPVQFDGNWITVFWLAEAVALFWIGRSQKVSFYQVASSVTLGLALLSLLTGWGNYYGQSLSIFYPIGSIEFTISMIFVVGLAAMRWIAHKYQDDKFAWMDHTLTALLLAVSYFSFLLEIVGYWNQEIGFTNDFSLFRDGYDEGLKSYSTALAYQKLWIINYTMIYLAGLSWLNIKKFKSAALGVMTLLGNSIAMSMFLLVGLYELSIVREIMSEGQFMMRYSSVAALFLLLFSSMQLSKQEFMNMNLGKATHLIFHVVLLWILTSETLTWLHWFESKSTYKLALSLLWGVYGFFLVIYGIWKRQKHLRIAAFILFGVLILKLFFFDLTHLETIAKTIVMISIGVILLIVSYLYNRYVGRIVDEE